MPKAKTAKPTFEEALKELELIVERMDSGQLSLEDSLQQFERGVELSRICQTSLKNAEQKVEQLIQKHGELAIEPFHEEPDEN
jgi:exodeoxyribonuclease VII small subunit